MKKGIQLLLFILILSPYLFKIAVFFNWMNNKNHIVEFICVERFYEENTCQGKCYLASQIQKIEKKHSEPSPQRELIRILEVDVFTFSIVDITVITEDKDTNFPIFSDCKGSQYLKEIIAPPPQYI